MPTSNLGKFIRGFERFRQDYFRGNTELFDKLRHGQDPDALVISCCDSRADPAIITNCAPGDLFVARDVANLVPPYEPDGGHHGVSASVEYAVLCLGVEHIVVLGHSQCGGIGALVDGGAHGAGGEFIGPWMSICQEEVRAVLEATAGEPDDTRRRACEQAVILVSLRNLMSFPWVRERVEAGRLCLHGWYFDIRRGELSVYAPEELAFRPLVSGEEHLRAPRQASAAG
ncbi:MAG: carbonic anhydrase [Desulfocurvibacter africanus]